MINCVICKNPIEYPEYIGSDFKGHLKCWGCQSVHLIHLVGGDVMGFCYDFNDMFEDEELDSLMELREGI